MTYKFSPSTITHDRLLDGHIMTSVLQFSSAARMDQTITMETLLTVCTLYICVHVHLHVVSSSQLLLYTHPTLFLSLVNPHSLPLHPTPHSPPNTPYIPPLTLHHSPSNTFTRLTLHPSLSTQHPPPLPSPPLPHLPTDQDLSG